MQVKLSLYFQGGSNLRRKVIFLENGQKLMHALLELIKASLWHLLPFRNLVPTLFL